MNQTSPLIMRPSSECLLELIQRFCKNADRVKQIHSLLITDAHLLHNSEAPSSLKWMPTLLYNALIGAHLSFGQAQKALLLFTHMLSHQATPNSFTFPLLIKSAAISSPSLGEPIHTQALKRGASNDPFVQTSLLGLYAEVGELHYARRMFEEINEPCTVASNAMLDAFAKNEDMGSAVLLFERMSNKDVVSWTSVTNGFLKNGCFIEAIRVFGKMTVKPNEATYVSVLSACANLVGRGALCRGKEVHGFIMRNEVEPTAFIGTALIDFYGKMGCLEIAASVFNLVDVKQVCMWNAMISALASNGREKEALDLFEKMKVEGKHRPNEVTFVVVLSACALGKHVELGLELFRSMSSEFAVIPIMEHYGCVVDLLGRAGLLMEANEFIKSMPIEVDASVLGAILAACKIHRETEMGNEVGRKLVSLQPRHCGRYVVLANINAQVEKWGSAIDARRAMAKAGIEI